MDILRTIQASKDGIVFHDLARAIFPNHPYWNHSPTTTPEHITLLRKQALGCCTVAIWPLRRKGWIYSTPPKCRNGKIYAHARVYLTSDGRWMLDRADGKLKSSLSCPKLPKRAPECPKGARINKVPLGTIRMRPNQHQIDWQ